MVRVGSPQNYSVFIFQLVFTLLCRLFGSGSDAPDLDPSLLLRHYSRFPTLQDLKPVPGPGS